MIMLLHFFGLITTSDNFHNLRHGVILQTELNALKKLLLLQYFGMRQPELDLVLFRMFLGQ